MLRSAKRMQAIITKITDQFGLGDDAMLKLKMEGYQPLTIERHGNRIYVSHTFVQNGDLMSDPLIIFAEWNDGWYPMEVQMDPTGYYRQVLWMDEAGKSPAKYATHAYANLVSFTNLWATNIHEQGWLKNGEKKG